jgi:hypothetical protein
MTPECVREQEALQRAIRITGRCPCTDPLLAPTLKPKLTNSFFRSSATRCAIARAAID